MMPAVIKLFNEMDKLLNSNFDPITKINACKMLVLMYKSSRNTQWALLPFVPPYISLVVLLFLINGLAAILTIATGIAFIFFLEQKRKDYLNKLSNLVYSDPEYWQPIREKLQTAIREK